MHGLVDNQNWNEFLKEHLKHSRWLWNLSVMLTQISNNGGSRWSNVHRSLQGTRPCASVIVWLLYQYYQRWPNFALYISFNYSTLFSTSCILIYSEQGSKSRSGGFPLADFSKQIKSGMKIVAGYSAKLEGRFRGGVGITCTLNFLVGQIL